ncbi:MAG: hypothetical protein Phog2KO_16520 [Phototrophicaceae bacterium]
MSKKAQFTERKIALCYIRLSFTRDESDQNSVNRQRANIQAVCDTKGWIPEWYEDAEGHKSGRSEKNRPAWLRLKRRLKDADVVALVANDLSRLHRRNWRIGSLIEELQSLGVDLTLAAPGRQQIDTTTAQGRMFVQMGAMFDEYYAEDIAKRARDSIAYRKSRGVTIGMPPFGTARNEDGLLIPSDDGAWYLPDGSYHSGTSSDIPADGAIWRSYFDCARYILEIYSEGKLGLTKVAYQLAEEGWFFRDRKNEPRPITSDDVRRVIANFPQYGGMISEAKATAIAGFEQPKADEYEFNPKRAVFPLDLLQKVAKVRKKRSKRSIDHGKKYKTFSYPLTQITYCAHCEQMAIKENDARLRTVLSGTNMNGTRRYRHSPGVKCGCTNKSVVCDIIEEEFGKLIQLLDVNPDSIGLMTEWAIQAQQLYGKSNGSEDIERQKTEAIALCRRRIDATVTLFGDGMIGKEEYRRRIDENEREISHWEMRTSETEKLGLEFAMCVNAVKTMCSTWETNSAEDKQGMARNLFESVVFDLDTHRIMGFRLKPWADRFLVVRGAMIDSENKNAPSNQGLKREMLHTRLELVFSP